MQSLYHTAKQKGLHILTTGDITQPAWRTSVKEQVTKKDNVYWYKDLAFIPGTELEDSESIHHLVFLPDFHSAKILQERLAPFVKNIDGRWAGRPHVNKTPAEIVDIITEVCGICGPAHAFTPFKSIFRQNKFRTLKEAYEGNLKHVAFLELGLSADSNLADRISSLADITFLSNSDAHSQTSGSLGREFNRIKIDAPNFEHIRSACLRKKNAEIVLNVGLDPRLGKYFIMFCRKCRRRIDLQVNLNDSSLDSPLAIFDQHKPKPTIGSAFMTYHLPNEKAKQDFLRQVSCGTIECQACKKEILRKITKKGPSKRKPTIPKLKLGVSERINAIADSKHPLHPSHRPPYIHSIPLVDIIGKLLNIKSQTSKTIQNAYNKLVDKYGTEYAILLDLPLDQLKMELHGKLAEIIGKLREGTVKYIPGGGGTYGDLAFL
jgi:PHP family Zn ribbon phosphoesterase